MKKRIVLEYNHEEHPNLQQDWQNCCFDKGKKANWVLMEFILDQITQWKNAKRVEEHINNPQ